MCQSNLDKYDNDSNGQSKMMKSINFGGLSQYFSKGVKDTRNHKPQNKVIYLFNLHQIIFFIEEKSTFVEHACKCVGCCTKHEDNTVYRVINKILYHC